jgi:hypothetical protein
MEVIPPPQTQRCVMKSVMCAVAVMVAIPVFACEAPPDVRTLASKGVKFDHKKASNAAVPVEIKSAEELAKSPLFADDASREEIKKQVDFAKEKLVVFVWSGSGQDRLTGELVKRGGTAQFTFTVGLTDDLRHHGQVFAVPNYAKVEVK